MGRRHGVEAQAKDRGGSQVPCVYNLISRPSEARSLDICWIFAGTLEEASEIGNLSFCTASLGSVESADAPSTLRKMIPIQLLNRPGQAFKHCNGYSGCTSSLDTCLHSSLSFYAGGPVPVAGYHAGTVFPKLVQSFKPCTSRV